MAQIKWPKTFAPLTENQKAINHDFVKHWHEILASRSRYSLIEKFNHGYVVNQAPQEFVSTLEIGAGLGEHLAYEKLTNLQKKMYVALELRENMAKQINARYPEITTQIGDCQTTLPFKENHFDRILAIHVLEHLPNLPAAIKEMYRLCNKNHGVFSVVIPCEGGFAYSLARKISAQRIFEKRYKQPYQWFIEREHVNQPHEIIEELQPYFQITNSRYFPLIVPIVNFNLCIGLTLHPRKELCLL